MKKLLGLFLPVLFALVLSGCYYANAPLSPQSFKDTQLLGAWQNINTDFDRIASLEVTINESNQYNLRKMYATQAGLKRENLSAANVTSKDYEALATEYKRFNVLSVEVESGQYNFFPYVIEGNRLTLYQISDSSWKRFIAAGQLKARTEFSSETETYYLEDTGAKMLEAINQMNIFSDMSIYAVLKK